MSDKLIIGFVAVAEVPFIIREPGLDDRTKAMAEASKAIPMQKLSGRCKTCKHWLETGDRGRGNCDSPKMNQVDNGYDVDGLIPLYDGTVSTGPDFGCVHHEPKP